MFLPPMDSVVAAFIISCSQIVVPASDTTSPQELAKARQECVQRVSACAKERIMSSTYGATVLDCAKEVK